MSNYRRGAIFGLTVAEMFILLTFILLIALLGLVLSEESDPQTGTENSAQEWVRPEEIMTLVNASEEERQAQEMAESARAIAENERDQALEKTEEVQNEAEMAQAAVEHERNLAHESVEEARQAQEMAESARAVAENERDQALEKVEEAQKEAEMAQAAVERERNLAHESVEEARQAQEIAESARAVAENERDQALEKVEEAQKEVKLAQAAVERERNLAHKSVEEARQAQEMAKEAQNAREQAELASTNFERERDLARRNLDLLRHKGENPPCWYKVVNTGEGKMRERRLYAFKVAIYEDGIELGQLTPPPGGALDDSSNSYADEWIQLRLDKLPYGKRLDDNEFENTVSYLYEMGMNRQVRTYECVFSVSVWDKTPDYAKQRWQYAHDELIERFFNAYTMKDRKWEDIE